MPDSSELITKRKLSEEVRTRLMHLLQSGELKPGDRMPSERDLMTRYGVGRPAVREALQALEKSGLIEIHHGERARVAQPNTNGILDQIGETVLHMLQTAPEMVGHLKQARLMFEVAMVRLAADQPNPEAIGKLEESVRKLEASIGDPLAVIEADMEFHVTIASMSGNPIFEAVTRSMLEWLFVNRRDMLRVPGAEQLTLEEHRRILGAIRSKNGAGANQAMWDHLSRSDKRYQSFDGNA